jgi:4-aminobutyrate aminotransferase-like enzyme
MWGFQRHGLVPDLVVMGKPMGNGYPMGGVAAKPEILEAFGKKNGYFNTFGGSPVAAAAGLAVLDILAAEGLEENARDTGAYLLCALQALAKKHETIGDVRGAGLYLGLEFVRDRKSHTPGKDAAVATINALRDRNILGGTTGLHGNIWKIRPPLCFRREHADMLVEGLDEVLSAAR